MAFDTTIQQGYFTSNGTDHYVPLISGVDWVKVYNWTNANRANKTAVSGVEWYWQSGMPQDDAFLEYWLTGASDATSKTLCSLGFQGVGTALRGISYFDTSLQTLGAARATTQSTNVVSPVVSAANTTGVNVGTIVRITNTAQTDLNGLDFTVGAVNPGVTFTMRSALQQAPGIAGGAGFYRVVAPSLAAYKLMYPSSRNICNITQAANAVVTTLVDHGYTVGQQIRFKIPTLFGMTQLSEVLGTITATTVNTFTIDQDTTGMTAFAYPTAALAAPAFTSAQCVPVGDLSTFGATTLAGAETNQSTTGILLGTSGVAAVALGSAGGTNGDIIYWAAGKSFATLVNV
jgi:hypothetical protein